MSREWLDFLVFSDKDDKRRYRPRLIALIPNNLWDGKESTHCSKTVGEVVPGVVLYLMGFQANEIKINTQPEVRLFFRVLELPFIII